MAPSSTKVAKASSKKTSAGTVKGRMAERSISDTQNEDQLFLELCGDPNASSDGEEPRKASSKGRRPVGSKWPNKVEQQPDPHLAIHTPSKGQSPARPKTPDRRADEDQTAFRTPSAEAAQLGAMLAPERCVTPSRRTRSPSPGSSQPLSARAKLAWKTMEGDVAGDEPVYANRAAVLNLLREPLLYKDERNEAKGQRGWVYAIRDPELELVKFGYTFRGGSKRLKEIRHKCRSTASGLLIVARHDDRPVYAAKRLENLIKADLAPCRWYWQCEGCRPETQKKKYTTHTEWFAITDEVANKTLRMWLNFIIQDPYGQPKFRVASDLTARWKERLAREGVARLWEAHEDHEGRIQYWTLFLGDEISDKTQQEGVIAKSTAVPKAFDGTPIKQEVDLGEAQFEGLPVAQSIETADYEELAPNEQNVKRDQSRGIARGGSGGSQNEPDGTEEDEEDAEDTSELQYESEKEEDEQGEDEHAEYDGRDHDTQEEYESGEDEQEAYQQDDWTHEGEEQHEYGKEACQEDTDKQMNDMVQDNLAEEDGPEGEHGKYMPTESLVSQVLAAEGANFETPRQIKVKPEKSHNSPRRSPGHGFISSPKERSVVVGTERQKYRKRYPSKATVAAEQDLLARKSSAPGSSARAPVDSIPSIFIQPNLDDPILNTAAPTTEKPTPSSHHTAVPDMNSTFAMGHAHHVKGSVNTIDEELIAVKDSIYAFLGALHTLTARSLLFLHDYLKRKRDVGPSRTSTVYEDLHHFRWPLACAIGAAVHAPYLPPIVSLLTWAVVLPSLVAALREW